MGEPAGILLIINKRAVSLLPSQSMPLELLRAMVVVELDIKEALAVLAPDDAAVGLLDEIVTILAISPVAHTNGKILRTLGVGAPRLQLVVMRMPRAAELEIFVAGCQRVAVEHDLHIPAIARRAPEHFMLPALAKLPQIGKRAVRRRYAGIILLDPPAHFRDQFLLQGRGVAEQALGVVVLGFEIFPNIRVQDRGVAQ